MNTVPQSFELYDEIAAKHNAAYAAFREIHTAKNPPPVKAKTERSDWLVSVALAVLVAASVVVSGSRTIVEFGGGLVGFMGFVMLELGIVSYAFIRTKSHMNEARLLSVQRWTNFGLLLAFIVAVAANIHATLTHASVALPGWINAVILLLLGISAPTLAVISGDILAVEFLRAATRKARIEREYADALSAWTDGLNRAWASQQARWGVRVEVRSEPLSVPGLSNGQSNGQVGMEQQQALPAASSIGHKKQPNATQLVREYLTENPDALSMDGRELALQLGVGKSTVYAVLKEFRQ